MCLGRGAYGIDPRSPVLSDVCGCRDPRPGPSGVADPVRLGIGRLAWHHGPPQSGGFPPARSSAPLAQSAERFHGKEKVVSSILTGGSGWIAHTGTAGAGDRLEAA